MQNRSPFAAGGSIVAIVTDAHETCWLAAEGGVWRGRPAAWQPLPAPPLLRTNALLALDDPLLLIAAGAPAALAYSTDGGTSWAVAQNDAVEVPIITLAAVSDRADRRALLAGTAGAGILRSTDDGRSWRLSNAGLQEFSIAQISAAPLWDADEALLFALSEHAIYRSPNAGRYWKRVAVSSAPLAGLVCLPNHQVVALSEDGHLLHSEDAGRTWTVEDPPSTVQNVSCVLALADGTVLVGCADGRIVGASDLRAAWKLRAQFATAVLALAHLPGMLLAGLADAGMACSFDAGHSWALEADLVVRDLTRLLVHADDVYVYGPTGGIWQAIDGDWARHAATPEAPITALALHADGMLWIATSAALYCAAAAGQCHATALPGAAPITAFSAAADWAGDAVGGLWYAAPEGWQRRFSATAPGAVLALCVAASGVTAAIADPRTSSVQLWRSDHAGRSWECLISLRTPYLRACLHPELPTWATLGEQVVHWDGDTWQPRSIDQRPLVALHPAAAGGVIIASTDGVYAVQADRWQPLPMVVAPGELRDLAVLADGTLLALGAGGRLIGH